MLRSDSSDYGYSEVVDPGNFGNDGGGSSGGPRGRGNDGDRPEDSDSASRKFSI